MATSGGSSKRAVRMDVEVTTSGGENVRSLANEVRKLGNDGSEAGLEFQRLAAELDRVAAQADAVKTISTLDAELGRAGEAAATAATAVDKLNLQYQEAMAATAKASVAYSTTVAELQRLKDANKTAALAMAQLANDTERSAKGSATYVAAQTATRAEILQNKNSILQLQQALRGQSEALAKAEADESKLASAFTKASRSAESANASLTERKAALEAAQVAAGTLGVQTDDLVAAQVRMTASTRDLAASASDLSRSLQAAATREAESAAIQAKFAEAVKAADKALAEQVATLRTADSAMAAYVAANSEAISAGERDVALNERRIKAARELLEQDRLLSIGQRELAASMNLARDATLREAQAQVEAADKAKASLAATQALVRESLNSGAAIQQAFGVIGVRSLNEIQAEMDQTEAALSLLERRFKAGAISAGDLERAVGGAKLRLFQLQTEIATVPAAPGVFERMSKSVGTLINKFGALSAAVATVSLAFKPVIDAEIELQRLRRVLDTVTGSSEKTASVINYLRDVSQASGQSFSSSAGAFSKFAAAATGAGMSIESVQKVFASTMKAAGTLGLETEATGRILNALGQIASKGTLQMEELKSQLGDALPGVLANTAKALGLTTGELTKMVESGQVLSVDAIPAIAKAMDALATKDGKIDGLAAAWTRFKNSMTETATNVAEGGLGAVLSDIFKGVTLVIKGAAFALSGFSESISFFAKSAAAVAAGVTVGFKGVGDEIKRLNDEGNARMEALKQRMFGLGQGATAAQAPVAALATATAATATAADAASASLQAQATASAVAERATRQVVEANTLAANAIGLASTAAGAGTSQWYSLVAAYDKAIASATLNAQLTQKLTQAKKEEGDALIATAVLAGNETQIQQARAAAAANLAAAAREQATADAVLVETLRQKQKALEDLSKAEGNASAERLKAVADIGDLIKKNEAEAEKTNQVAAALEREAASRRIAVEALKDNSASLGEYQKAAKKAYDELERVQLLQANGLATLEDVRKADIRLAEAEARVRDALKDTADAAARNIKALQDKNSIVLAGLNLQKAQIQAEIAIYEADGDTYNALQSKIKLKELEIQIIRATIDAKIAEIKATRLQIEADIEAAKATGTFNEAKKAEIEARLAAIKVKELEAEAMRAGIGLIEKQIDNLRVYGTESRKAYESSAKAIDGETSAIDRNTKSRDANYAALVRSANARSSTSNGATYDKNGWALNTNGQVISARANTPQFVLSSLQSAGFTAREAEYLSASLVHNGQIVLQGEYSGMTLDGAIAKLISKNQDARSYAGVTNSNLGFTDFWSTIRTDSGGTLKVTPGKTSGGAGWSPFSPPAPAPAPQGTAAPASVHRVIIEGNNGSTTTVDAATYGDAQGLVSVLEALGSAARRAA